MLLAIDVGNTNVLLGLFQGEELSASWRLQSNPKRTVDEYALEITGLFSSNRVALKSVRAIIVCSVVPNLSRVFAKLSEKYFQLTPFFVDAKSKLNLVIHYEDPGSLGTDRIVNAVAAKHLVGVPVIIVDCGTATKFDVVGESGNYEGGVIAPGLLISAEALFERAALLPTIELRSPEHVLGKNTQDAMLSGIIYGFSSLVDGIVSRLLTETSPEAQVIATGGAASLLALESKYISQVIPDLTLQGLQVVASLNGISSECSKRS